MRGRRGEGERGREEEREGGGEEEERRREEEGRRGEGEGETERGERGRGGVREREGGQIPCFALGQQRRLYTNPLHLIYQIPLWQQSH